MRNSTVRTILDPLLRVPKISSAPFAESIKRTIAEQAVEMFRINAFVTGEKLAFPVAEIFVVFTFFVVHNGNYKTNQPSGPLSSALKYLTVHFMLKYSLLKEFGAGSVKRKVYQIIKRAFDVIVSAVGLVLLSPLLLVLAVLVRINLGAPVFFRQERPGLNGKIFMLYKFRSMKNGTDRDGNLLPDEARLSKFGKILRASSLDELPELFNVLKGEMSLVGPRPLLVKYLELYSPEQRRRHEVLPGITGWAQVNGRNAVGWEERFRMDVWYVDHWTPWLDLKILLLTVKKVFIHEGISAENQATMEEFKGNQ